MSGGVPAGSRDQVAQIVARAYGGSLYPGIGTPGDYPTADVDYRAADAILALPTPTPPIEGRDADVERVEVVAKAIYDATHVGLSNCYAWDDEWEPYQEARRGRYYKEAAAAIAALQALGERG